MRARQPDIQGVVEHDGVTIGYEVFEGGDDASDLTFVLLPTWTIVHSRFWKLQVPFLARHHRVVTFDGPGNGRSDRTTDPAHYTAEWHADATREVLDATDTETAVLGSLSVAANYSMATAHRHSDRVSGQVHIDPSVNLAPPPEWERLGETFYEEIENPVGMQKMNAHYWQHHYGEFAQFWFEQCFSEPHSTKQREDCARWAGETSPEVLLSHAAGGSLLLPRETLLEWCSAVDHPVLVIHGDDDHISPVANGKALAEASGGELVVLAGAGHIPLARDPVKVNRLLLDFARRTLGHHYGVTA